jgi:hypothetical protein
MAWNVAGAGTTIDTVAKEGLFLGRNEDRKGYNW